jgi:hypothetical protein
MVNAKTICWKTWAQRVGFAAIAVLCAGASVFAQEHLVEEGSPDVSYQCSNCEDQCECDQRKAIGGLSRPLGGKVCNWISGVKHNATMLGQREAPRGDMSLHFPYQLTQMYYYRRPYNHQHVPSHLAEPKGSPDQSTLGENLVYSNQIFEQAHESAEAYFSVQNQELEKDGLLEHVDWRKHQQERLKWEAAPGRQMEPSDQSFSAHDSDTLNRSATDLRRSRSQDEEMYSIRNRPSLNTSSRRGSSAVLQARSENYMRR